MFKGAWGAIIEQCSAGRKVAVHLGGISLEAL
jgi:hypothetical protein